MTTWIASAPIMFTTESLIVASFILALPFVLMIIGAIIREPLFVATFALPVFLAAVWILASSTMAAPPTAEEYAAHPDIGGDQRLFQSFGLFLLFTSGFGATCMGIAWMRKHEVTGTPASDSSEEKWT